MRDRPHAGFLRRYHIRWGPNLRGGREEEPMGPWEAPSVALIRLSRQTPGGSPIGMRVGT